MTKDELIGKLDSLTAELQEKERDGSADTVYRIEAAGRILDLLFIALKDGHLSEMEALGLTAGLALKLTRYSLVTASTASDVRKKEMN